jgi:hypothetical protein
MSVALLVLIIRKVDLRERLLTGVVGKELLSRGLAVRLGECSGAVVLGTLRKNFFRGLVRGVRGRRFSLDPDRRNQELFRVMRG